MASVQELLLAAQNNSRAKASPFLSLVEGMAGGFRDSMANAPQRQNIQLQMQERQIAMEQQRQDRLREEEAQKQMRAEIAGQANSHASGIINGAAVKPAPVMAGAKVTFEQDSKGKYSKKTVYDPSEGHGGSGGMTKDQLLAFSSGDPEAIARNFPNGIPDQSLRFGTAFMNANAQAGERKAKRADRRSQEQVTLVDRFNADASVKKNQQAIDGAANVVALVDSGNPIAAAAIPTFMARASGEVGNLSEEDKAPFGGSRAIFARLEAAAKQASDGKLTTDNAKFVKDLGAIMSKRANDNMDKLARTRAAQYGKANDFLTAEEIYSSLRPDSQSAPEAKSAPVSEIALGGVKGARLAELRKRAAGGGL